MGCPVRWGSVSLPPGLVVAVGFQQARSPTAVFGRGAEGCCGTGSEHPHVGCSLSSPRYQALLLQSYSVVLCILAHGRLHQLGQVRSSPFSRQAVRDGGAGAGGRC